MKRLLVVFVILVLLLLSCSPYRWSASITEKTNVAIPKLDPIEGDGYRIRSVEYEGLTEDEEYFLVSVVIENTGSDDIFLLFNELAFVYEGQVYRAFNANVKKIVSDLQIPNQVIPSQTIYNAVIAVESTEFIGEKSKKSGFSDITVETPIDPEEQAACYITAMLYGGYCWFLWEPSQKYYDRAEAMVAEKQAEWLPKHNLKKYDIDAARGSIKIRLKRTLDNIKIDVPVEVFFKRSISFSGLKHQ